jgi:20S proteasome alpha/beta subunit
MTIAAGFVASDGILLCADTLYTDGYTKQYGEKIFTWRGNGISVCFALAGNATMAKMAVDFCTEALSALDPGRRYFADAFDAIRSVIKYTQHEYVDKVPLEERERSRFWLLITIHTEDAGLRMYSTNDAAISPVHDYECIGAGRQIGMYIIEPSYWRFMTVSQMSVLAIHALTAAKERVDGVGGRIDFIAIRGSVISPIMEHDIETSEKCILKYRTKCAEILLDIGNGQLGDLEFSQRLESFIEDARFIRAQWKGGSALWKNLKEWIDKTTESGKSDPQSTTADPSPLPPLQE